MTEQGTLFKRVDYTLEGLLQFIDMGDIGLPDIQRRFVWTTTKVRDLFDSMYKGFPVGYLIFWANSESGGFKTIGTDEKAHKVPRLLIVDGQQRLTSLYAVFQGRPVLDKNYREKRLEIAFRPHDGKFEVADAAIRRDPEFIPNISEIWTSGKSSYSNVNKFLKNLEEKRSLSEDEIEIISNNLDHLFDLRKYPFSALEITHTVDEEDVADIFVRINSAGVTLKQADFILTLLSVFWEKGRLELENFSRESKAPPAKDAPASPHNHFIQPSPDQLLRVSIAVGFKRARLRNVYQLLRGKDLETGTFSDEHRERHLARLGEAQLITLNLTKWHQYFSCLIGAGFRSGELISSANTLLFTYAFYLIGRTEFGVPEHELQRLIGRWFYASTLSGRYTASPETSMETDLNRLKDMGEADAFVAELEKIITDTLTSDFWAITLPNDLETSSARSPGLLTYYAAQNKLGAPVLFSDKKISDLLDPSVKMKKKPLDRHHLFPRAWLESQGITDMKLINQVGNFALLEWPENIEIGMTPPAEYVPIMRERFQAEDFDRMCQIHALPDGWENMPYSDFLVARRALMAQIIRRGFESLK